VPRPGTDATADAAASDAQADAKADAHHSITNTVPNAQGSNCGANATTITTTITAANPTIEAANSKTDQYGESDAWRDCVYIDINNNSIANTWLARTIAIANHDCAAATKLDIVKVDKHHNDHF
jgi:hypothetical protein